MIEIRRKDWRLELEPERGGSMAKLTFGGFDLLRPTLPHSSHIFDTANFALVPFANRIAHGRFKFRGQDVIVPRNIHGQAHPLHGFVCLRSWQVSSLGEDRAILRMDAAADESWPWSYSVAQTFVLDEAGLAVTLSVTNLDSAPFPGGIGFHPYFPCAGQANIRANFAGAWLNDQNGLPAAYQARPLIDWAKGAPVRGSRLIDNCHDGWDGNVTVDWPARGLSLTMTASPELSRLHIYAPPDQEFFCLEPVSHRPDALNADDPEVHGMRILQPGATFAATLRFSAALTGCPAQGS